MSILDWFLKVFKKMYILAQSVKIPVWVSIRSQLKWIWFWGFKTKWPLKKLVYISYIITPKGTKFDFFSFTMNNCNKISLHTSTGHCKSNNIVTCLHTCVFPTSLFLDPADLESSLNMARDLSWFTKSLSDLQHKTRQYKFYKRLKSTLTTNFCRKTSLLQ